MAAYCVILSGCITIPDQLHPPTNTEFASQVSAAAPIGTTETKALATMRARGYLCSIDTASSGFPGHGDGRQRVVSCEYHGHIAGQFFDRDWSAFFLIEGGRVAKVVARTDLSAP